MSIPNYYDKDLDDEKRKIGYSKRSLVGLTLGYKFFDGNITSKPNFEFKSNDDSENPNPDRLKTELLDFAIENEIEMKQINTFDDSSFRLRAKKISVECIKKSKEYAVETHE